MQTVSATLYIHVYVDCPHCQELIDLLNEDDTDGVAHNDCGDILREACPDKGHWTDSHDQFELDDVTCTKCKTTFNVRKIEW